MICYDCGSIMIEQKEYRSDRHYEIVWYCNGCGITEVNKR
jgi:RNase P subunit RPR2